MTRTKADNILLSIIIINTFFFVYSTINPNVIQQFATVKLALAPTGLVGTSQGEWWRLFTGAFLHGDIGHIFFNMLILWLLGRPIINTIGPTAFLAAYFTSIAAGSLGAIWLDPTTLTIGASGGVFGIMGLAAVMQEKAGIDWKNSGLKGLLIINIIITFAIPGISIGGHIGGLAGGALVGLIWKKSSKEKPAENQTPTFSLNGPVILFSAIVFVSLFLPLPFSD